MKMLIFWIHRGVFMYGKEKVNNYIQLRLDVWETTAGETSAVFCCVLALVILPLSEYWSIM